VGKEYGDHSFIQFYGTSFITNATGEVVTDASEFTMTMLVIEDEDGIVLTATFDLDQISASRASWGLFRLK
jgi:N-carbamoylputrescine amidase